MTPKQLTPSEYQECLWLREYLDILKAQGKIIAYTHVPNETYTTSWSAKRKNKAMGVAKGFPDYVILARGTMVFIEMKATKKGKISIEQENWIEYLDKYSNMAARVCFGFEDAKEFLESQLQEI